MSPIRNFLVFAAFSASPLTWAGNTCGNGGGLGEQNLASAWLAFPRILETCLAIPGCRGEGEQSRYLRTLLDHHPAEVSQGGLEFTTPSRDNRLLDPSGKARFFATEARVGSKIQVNAEALYIEVPGRPTPAPYDLEQSVSLLTDALSEHHLGTSPSVVRLARLALSKVLSAHPVELTLSDLGQNEARLLILKSERSEVLALTVSDANEVHDLTPELKSAVVCGSELQTPEKVKVWNLAWQTFPEFDAERSLQSAHAEANVTWSCPGGKSFHAELGIRITYKVEGDDHRFLLVPDRSRIQATRIQETR